MKKILLLSSTIILFLLVMGLTLGCAETPSEFEASGTFEQTKAVTPDPETENGKMTFEGMTYYMDVHGTMEGTIVFGGTMVIDLASGSYTIAGEGTFTGLVEGKSGSYDYTALGNGHFTSPTGESGETTGEHTIIGGTGELAKLRGSLQSEAKFDKKTGVVEAYSGTCWFEE
jgi:hypothetical protein